MSLTIGALQQSRVLVLWVAGHLAGFVYFYFVLYFGCVHLCVLISFLHYIVAETRCN
jgi:hypothetical protein